MPSASTNMMETNLEQGATPSAKAEHANTEQQAVKKGKVSVLSISKCPLSHAVSDHILTLFIAQRRTAAEKLARKRARALRRLAREGDLGMKKEKAVTGKPCLHTCSYDRGLIHRRTAPLPPQLTPSLRMQPSVPLSGSLHICGMRCSRHVGDLA